MELKQAVIFAILERTTTKKRKCTVNNVLKNLEVFSQFKNLEKEEIVRIMGELIQEGVIDLVQNPYANNKNEMICMQIKKEVLKEVQQLYEQNIIERYSGLAPNSAQILQNIYKKHVIMHEPYILDNLAKDEKEMFDEVVQELGENGFVKVVDSYSKDGEILNCDIALITLSGKKAFEKNLEKEASSQEK